jgi:hypothetical protein
MSLLSKKTLEMNMLCVKAFVNLIQALTAQKINLEFKIGATSPNFSAICV